MRKEVELSERLQALAHMVTPGNRVCDVGCDHGFLSIYLVQKKISPRVIAMDVRSGPLSRCTEHVLQYGLEQYIERRLSDGLSALEIGEADTVVCAGMGGRLMQKILSREEEKAQRLKELILQPQSEVMEFRRFLRSRGYVIAEENMIEEEGKFYPMMKVVPDKESAFVSVDVPASGPAHGGAAVSDEVPVPDGVPVSDEKKVFDRFGEKLLVSANPVLRRYLDYRRKVLVDIRENIQQNMQPNIPEAADGAGRRLFEIDEELRDIESAYEYYQ